MRLSTLTSGLAVVLLTAGCGPDGPTLAPVSGTVTLRGRPLPRGDILFVADDLGPTAIGQIGSDGRYTLTTFRPGDGAKVGTHRVMIAALSDSAGSDPGGLMPPPLTPAKYGDYTTSGLTATVKEGDNVIDFDLK